MKPRIVGMRNLDDWDFEQVVCSSFPKKLTVMVWPAVDTMYFRAYKDNELLKCFDGMSEAVAFYNKI